MANFNVVVVIGRVNGDPELRYSQSGAPICTFSIATYRRMTNEAGEKVDQATFLDVEASAPGGDLRPVSQEGS